MRQTGDGKDKMLRKLRGLFRKNVVSLAVTVLSA